MEERSFINKLKEHPWISAFLAFLIGTLLGPGSLWQYTGLKITKQQYELDELKHENNLRQQLLLLQSNILSEAQTYIELRDRFVKIDSVADNYYEYQNKYNRSKAHLIKLVSEYNTIEGDLSILEERHPVFFNIKVILPPLSPQNLTKEYNDDGTATIKWDIKCDEVEEGVNDHLKTLIDQHNQKVK